MNNTIATTIAQQLGGNKFIAMTGATLATSKNGLTINFKGSKVANVMFVTLGSDDTYNLTFAKFKGVNFNVVKDIRKVYSDSILSIFEQTTGLRTSL